MLAPAQSLPSTLPPALVERRLEGILVRDRAGKLAHRFRFEGEDALDVELTDCH